MKRILSTFPNWLILAFSIICYTDLVLGLLNLKDAVDNAVGIAANIITIIAFVASVFIVNTKYQSSGKRFSNIYWPFIVLIVGVPLFLTLLIGSKKPICEPLASISTFGSFFLIFFDMFFQEYENSRGRSGKKNTKQQSSCKKAPNRKARR